MLIRFGGGSRGIAAAPLSSAVRLRLTGTLTTLNFEAVPPSPPFEAQPQTELIRRSLPVRRSLTALESGKAARLILSFGKSTAPTAVRRLDRQPNVQGDPFIPLWRASWLASLRSIRDLFTKGQTSNSTMTLYFAIVDGEVANLPTLRSASRGTFSIVNSIKRSTTALRSLVSL